MKTSVTVVSTAAMAVSMLQLFVIGVLGPVLVAESVAAPWQLGLLVATGFGVAAALSLPAGALVDRVGPGRCLVGVFVLSAVALAVLAIAPSAWWIAAGVLVGGVSQALANPVTNKVIVATVEPAARSSVVGWKQAGVQLGSFVAGVPLAAVAALVDWRWGVAALAALCLGGAVSAARLAVRVDAPIPPSPGTRVGRRVALLAVFSLTLGFGLAAVTTYLTLYGVEGAGLPVPVAAWLVAAMGLVGIAGRVLWAKAAGRVADPASVLAPLAVGAAASAALLAAAGALPWLVWLGAVGIGVFGAPANAVAMVAVMAAAPQGAAGRAAAVASAGFYSGYVLGPTVAGLVLTRAGYAWLWSSAGAAFLASAAVAVLLARRVPAAV